MEKNPFGEYLELYHDRWRAAQAQVFGGKYQPTDIPVSPREELILGQLERWIRFGMEAGKIVRQCGREDELHWPMV